MTQQNNIWHFGVRAGVNFTPRNIDGAPYAIMQNVMTASEGCASVCDDDGNMLFYTNGKTIYNNTGTEMLNGQDLAGNLSSFQSAIIVPLPNSTKQFYVFTTDAFENNFANGYHYSVVDMSLDNGKGAVAVKNVLLNAPGTERIAAARHANGVDMWIIGNDYNSNVFRVWLLTCTGLQTNPIVSTVGEILNQHGFMNVGSLKVSPDGKHLCQSHFPDLNDSLAQNFFQLFDFNNVTGIISNPKKIEISNIKYYAGEFSPNSKLLYMTRADEGVDQFDCTLNNASQVTATQIPILTGKNFCGIQLGPDQKIYLCFYSNKLSVISKPNVKGAGCSFQVDKIDLGGRFGSLNLPTFPNDISVEPFNNFSIQIQDSCTGLVKFNGFTNFLGVVSWSWNFGDGGTSTIQNPQHQFADPYKFYTVKLQISSPSICGKIVKSKILLPRGVLTQTDFTAIGFCDSGYVRFVNKSIFYPDDAAIQYVWDFGDGNVSSVTNPIYSYPRPGQYPVKLKIKTGPSCVDDSLSKSVNVEKLDIQASPNVTINEHQSVQLKVTGGGSIFLWEPPTWLSNSTIANPIATPKDDIMYRVTVTNDAGCTDTDTVYIKINMSSDIFVPTAFTPNGDGKNDIFKPIFSPQFTLEKFTIYNRWGQEIFATSEISKGWDGKINGQLQNSGTYIWKMSLLGRYKNKVEKSGTVVLIR